MCILCQWYDIGIHSDMLDKTERLITIGGYERR
jgi:hypothetical protein